MSMGAGASAAIVESIYVGSRSTIKMELTIRFKFSPASDAGLNASLRLYDI